MTAPSREVDVRGPRFAAWVTTVVLAVVLLTGSGWLLAVQAVVFAVGAFASLRSAPYGVLFRVLVAPRLGPVREREPELIEALLGLLSDATRPSDDVLPRTGVGEAWERLLSSAFIASEHYGTRSSTVVLVGRTGNAIFVEQGFAPGGIPGELRRFEFRVAEP